MILNCIERSKFSNELRKIRKAEETGKGRGRGQYIFLALFYYSWGVRKFRSFYGVLIFLTRIPTILDPFDPSILARFRGNQSIFPYRVNIRSRMCYPLFKVRVSIDPSSRSESQVYRSIYHKKRCQFLRKSVRCTRPIFLWWELPRWFHRNVLGAVWM